MYYFCIDVCVLLEPFFTCAQILFVIEDELHQVDPSLYNQQHRQGTDILEFDSSKAPSQAPSGTFTL